MQPDFTEILLDGEQAPVTKFSIKQRRDFDKDRNVIVGTERGLVVLELEIGKPGPFENWADILWLPMEPVQFQLNMLKDSEELTMKAQAYVFSIVYLSATAARLVLITEEFE